MLGPAYASGSSMLRANLVAQSWEEAAKYYGIAAAQGNADAELNLAFLMIRELAIGDQDLGLEILAESAENGDQKAVWALYQLYSDGRYLPADPKTAEAWLLKAVEAGLAGRHRRAWPKT